MRRSWRGRRPGGRAEVCRDAHAEGAGRAGRDVVVAVRRGEVVPVENILDVDLGAHALVEAIEHGGVEADEAWQRDGVVGRGEDRIAIDRADADAPLRAQVVAVPERKRVPGQLGEPRAGAHRGRLGRLDAAVLVGIAAGDAPFLAEAAGDAEFHALGALTVDQDRLGRIRRVGNHDVAAVEAVGRGGKDKVGADIPLQSELEIREFLRIEGAVGEAQRGKLLAGPGDIGRAVAGVGGEILERLVDQADAGRDQVITAVQRHPRAVVAEIHVEFLQAHADDGLQLRQEGDLVLHIDGDGLRNAVIVGIGRARLEGDRQGGAGIRQRHEHGGRRRADRGEVAGQAQVVSLLPGQFKARQHLVLHGPDLKGDDHIGLVEQVVAVRRIVVSRERDAGAGGVHRTGEDVLVGFRVGAEAGGVAQREAAGEFVVQRDEDAVHRRFRGALRRIAEEGRGGGLHRAALVGGNAAIGRPLVVEILVAQVQPGPVRQGPGQRGIRPVTLQGDVITVAAGILVEAGHAERRLAVDRLRHVEGRAVLFPLAELQGQFVHDHAVGLLGDPVDQAAGTAAAKNHGIGALQDLDPVDVVEVAVVLHVVAHAIDEEVGGRAVAAEHGRIAVAFALRDADAGHVAGHVADAPHRLVIDQLAGDDGDGLRHIHQGRIGLRGRHGALDGIAQGMFPPVHGDFLQMEHGTFRRQVARGGEVVRAGGAWEQGPGEDEQEEGAEFRA